ncbi:peptidoglycan-binding domain-containing protein [Sorangium sp. So ce1078]|uniref:peptidoglycan-binding domain-containing protein n=1 Tax=Sorangium sp. So ce1078 TaxID=3133329 RepID=UPI003F637720
MRRHRIEQGDSVVRLAEQYGFAPDTIWNHPDNAELKALRKDMNVLAPGDMLAVPDLRLREEACATGRRHVFRRRGVPTVFRAQLYDRGEARRNEPYELEVDGRLYTGQTDDEGKIEVYLPNGARRGRLVVNRGEVDAEVRFGHMDPITEIAGVQKRLANLGFEVGAIDGVMHARLSAALRAFQTLVGLAPTAELDDETRAALADCHDLPDKLEELAERAAKAIGGG